MKHHTILALVAISLSASVQAQDSASAERRHEINQKVQEGLAFDWRQTKQAFTKSVHGGIQHLFAKSIDDTHLIKAIQVYMLRLASQFRAGDFADTERIHGADMPGLAELKKAGPNDIKFEYKALPTGAQIHFVTEDTHLLENLHAWFEAQIKDHGNADVSEHTKHHLSPAE